MPVVEFERLGGEEPDMSLGFFVELVRGDRTQDGPFAVLRIAPVSF